MKNRIKTENAINAQEVSLAKARENRIRVTVQSGIAHAEVFAVGHFQQLSAYAWTAAARMA